MCLSWSLWAIGTIPVRQEVEPAFNSTSTWPQLRWRPRAQTSTWTLTVTCDTDISPGLCCDRAMDPDMALGNNSDTDLNMALYGHLALLWPWWQHDLQIAARAQVVTQIPDICRTFSGNRSTDTHISPPSTGHRPRYGPGSRLGLSITMASEGKQVAHISHLLKLHLFRSASLHTK